jgi:hypothetical protein
MRPIHLHPKKDCTFPRGCVSQVQHRRSLGATGHGANGARGPTATADEVEVSINGWFNGSIIDSLLDD